MEAGRTASTPARQAAPRRSAGRRGPLLQGPSRPPSTSPCRLAPGARVPGTCAVEGSRRIADRGVGDLPATPVLRRCQRPRGQFDPASSRRRGSILRPRKPLDLGPHPERSHADSDISRRPVRLLQILGSGSIAGHLTQENSRSQTDGGRGAVETAALSPPPPPPSPPHPSPPSSPVVVLVVVVV